MTTMLYQMLKALPRMGNQRRERDDEKWVSDRLPHLAQGTVHGLK
jgi:hypothetical protein